MFSSLKGICRLSISIPILFVVALCYFSFDLWIAGCIHQYTQLYHSLLLYCLAILGSGPVMLSISFLLYFSSRIFFTNKKLRIPIAQVGLTLLISNIIVLFSKTIIGRARPLLWFDQHLYGFYGPTLNTDFWSFPSGHAVTVMSIAWSLSILYSRYAVIWLVLAMLVVSTRILLLQHFLSDVLVSTYLALIVSVAIQQYHGRWKVYV